MKTHCPNHRASIAPCVLLTLLLGVSIMPARPVNAQAPVPDIVRDVSFEQRLDAQVPLDTQLRDEAGNLVAFGALLNDKPTVLTLNYLHCKNLCPIILDSLVGAFGDLSFTIGKDYNVITLSIDPRELPALAAARKMQYLKSYARSGADGGWHFLTGATDDIHRVADAVGFHYAYDARQDEFAHPVGIILLTPSGKVSRYLYGTEISSQDLRLALVEASQNQIGSAVDQLLLVCYHYDPSLGRYSPLALDIVRWAGLVSVTAIGAFLVLVFRWEARHYRKDDVAMAGRGRKPF